MELNNYYLTLSLNDGDAEIRGNDTEGFFISIHGSFENSDPIFDVNAAIAEVQQRFDFNNAVAKVHEELHEALEDLTANLEAAELLGASYLGSQQSFALQLHIDSEISVVNNLLSALDNLTFEDVVGRTEPESFPAEEEEESDELTDEEIEAEEEDIERFLNFMFNAPKHEDESDELTDEELDETVEAILEMINIFIGELEPEDESLGYVRGPFSVI